MSSALGADELYPSRQSDIEVRSVDVGDGLRLRVLQSGPVGGPAAVLLHGWGASVYSWRAAMSALAADGFRVIAADLPGHGLSDTPTALATYTRRAMTDAVGSLLDALNVHDATVVGVSMGGAIAVGLAIAHHPRVARVALVNPAGFGRIRGIAVARLLAPLALRRQAWRLTVRPLVSAFLHFAYADRTLVSPRDVDEYWATVRRPGVAAAIVACLHQFSWDSYSADSLRNIGCPVLLVLGTRDHLMHGSETHAREIRRLRVVRIVGGHAVNEECPQAVNAALAAFARE